MKKDLDTQLMLCFKEGDQHAFQMLVKIYKVKIHNYCYRFCADRAVAEELTQEVFLRVYNAAPTYKPKAKFSTWLFRIATNICLNERRSQKDGKKVEYFDASDDRFQATRGKELQTSLPPDPREQLEFKEKEKFIRQSILDLPAKQRAAILLRLYHDFSYREISQQLNTTEGDVKTLIHRGRNQLKEALQGYLQGE